MKNYMGIMPCF